MMLSVRVALVVMALLDTVTRVASMTIEETRVRDENKALVEQTVRQGSEVVVPYIVDKSGKLITYDVHKFHRRRKRSLNKSNNSIYVNVTGFGENFNIELWQNKDLLAPGFKVYHRKGNTNVEHKFDTRDQNLVDDEASCMYTGKVKSHGGELASMSVCNGMKGIIRTAEEDYIIEPVEHHRLRDNHQFGNPHRMYKRSALGLKQNQFCGAKTKMKRDTAHTSDGKVVEEEDSHVIEKRAADKWTYSRENRNADKTVETLVVVDKTMYHLHGEQNITTYSLTLFNMVSQLFKDSSLGNRINIVLVGLILLEGDEFFQQGLSIGHHADKTLNSFCSWQSVLVGANGRQHDHAILLTGVDLCSYKNAPCDTLGFAPIEGMCNRIRSCTINEDTGLSTAFTIAHEIGHNFGMFHDGEGNYCTESAGKIMSPTLMGKDGQLQWSVCSRAYLLRFFNTPQSDCLDDKPKYVAELKFPDKMPGELYDADIQCKWQFGKKAKLCTYDFGKDICKALWCFRGNMRCETKFLPAAEGTSCGHGMWCRQGECVSYGEEGPVAIHGSWSEWSEWSECSRTCGGGIRSKERECNRPLPQYGGRSCRGDDKTYKMCNVNDCEDGDKNIHAIQCAIYDKQPFRGWYLQWKPYKKLYDVREPCKLHCVAETYNYVFTIKHTAMDGMKCSSGGGVCVDGVCTTVGCDWIVGSDTKSDICGVCKGDNSTCEKISGEYTEQPKMNTYFPIAIIPKSARSVLVRENTISSNYLAVRNIFGDYFLNGQHRVAWPGAYNLGGTKFIYRRPYNQPETLESVGPLAEDLVIEILVQDRNPGITYEYTIPLAASKKDMTTAGDSYTWSVSVSSCTEPCAGGKKIISASCHRNLNEEVEPTFCDNSKKPETGMFPCNEQACPPRWVPDEWQECTRSCGGGKQLRRIRCRQKVSTNKDKKLRKRFCNHLPKPIKKRKCNKQECPPAWHAGKWSKCSVSCGRGQQSRKVVCRSKALKGYKVMTDTMCHEDKPSIVKSCVRPYCPSTDKFDWLLSPWGPCSVSCGEGIQHRDVKCVDLEGNHSEKCDGLMKPTTSQACRAVECQVKMNDGKIKDIYECLDRDSWCYLVREHKACDNDYYRANCCQTCQGG